MEWIKFSLFVIVCCLGLVAGDDYKRVCYWASWAVYRPGEGKHLVKDIDPNICTHLIYTFAKVTSDKILTSYDPWCDYDDGLGNFRKFNDLRKANPKLKTLLAVGGWNLGSVVFSDMAMTQAGRKIFIDSTIAFIRKHRFDGFDLDWEYPADRGGKPEDKPNFSLLCKEFKEAFMAEGRATNQEPLLITAAVSAGERTIKIAYEVPEISKHLDFINVMTYDLHGAWEKFADHNSPLYPRNDQDDEQKQLTTSWAVDYWIKNGLPAKKLIMGVPLYGRSFNLANGNNNKPGAAVNGPGPAGTYSREPGIIIYYEICTNFRTQSGWNRVWHDEYQVPYAYKGNFWIGYDDAKSIMIKSQYIKKKGLGGAMVWSIESDDFKNVCGNGKDVLMNIIKQVLTDGKVPDVDNMITPPPPPPPTTADPSRTTLRPPPVVTNSEGKPTGDCSSEGYFEDPNDCSKFYQCVANGNTFIKYDFNCPAGLAYEKVNKICNFKEQVPGCN